MEKAGLISLKNINPPPVPTSASTKSQKLPSSCLRIRSSSRKNDSTLITRKRQRHPRRLITISTGDGRWQGKWNCDYVFTLQDLHLQDLAEDGHQGSHVSVNLSVQKHASFGFSVDGRIITSFTRKCGICSALYYREIDATFSVWVLPACRDNGSPQIPEIGGDDPSLSYEVDLDPLVQDTIRLNTAVKETCSEACERSEPKLHYIGGKRDVTTFDKRWSTLLHLRNSYS
ncbi:hypothetical protein RJ641_034973 [Dillenia turbinata]|uniref:Uncharacterized protein n=1 Tax=Dillenia turbinata TaxID=194707 RepID=A0AAN8ZI29_9MAGN